MKLTRVKQSLIATLLVMVVVQSLAQSAELLTTATGISISSQLKGEHRWTGGALNGRASGEGLLTVFEQGDWIGRAKQIAIEGEMVNGEFDGWTDGHFYREQLYWLGGLKALEPEGCGVGAKLAKNGGRIDETLRIEKRENGKIVADSKRECDQVIEKQLAKKAGKFLGKSLVDCLLQRKVSCITTEARRQNSH